MGRYGGGGTRQVPKGFYETRQRIRAAYEVREKVLQQREAGHQLSMASTMR